MACPDGQWTILRGCGHTHHGRAERARAASGRGLECDKLSPEGSEANFAGLMAKVTNDVGASAARGSSRTHIDSWENGSQNWTPQIREEFRSRRGYDMQPYMPI